MDEIFLSLQNLSVSDLKIFLKTQNVEKLKKAREKLADIYYNTGESTVPDQNYDVLVEEIKSRGIHIPVGATLKITENRVNLPFWMGSIDKITPEEPDKFMRWVADNKAENYVITAKLDGVSCLIQYNMGKISLYTRGDGKVGADISYLAQYLKFPKYSSNIFVRGELIMKRDIFEKKYKDTYRNPRNMVSGLVGAKTLREGMKDVEFVAYEILSDSTSYKPSRQLSSLKLIGFNVVQHNIVNNISLSSLQEIYMKFKASSEYDIDGIVVQGDNSYDRNISGNPDYMFAFKMLLSENVHNTTVQQVEWGVSKWGQLKPVVIIDPVVLNDIVIKRVTAHNAKYVVDNGIGPGAVIQITRSKDVIPYIVKVLIPAPPQLPEIPYEWDKNHVNIVTGSDSSTMCIKLLTGIFSKLGIKHVSEATVTKLYNAGLNNFIKIISASQREILALNIPGFGDKSVERIYTNIREGLKNVNPSTLLGASGVLGYGVGQRRIDSLLLYYPDLFTMYKGKSKQEMMKLITAVDGFSDIMAEKVVVNLKHADMFLQILTPYTTFKREERVSTDMKGLTFVFSGFRDKKLEEDIRSRGGKVTTSVSGKTTAVIVADKSAKLTGKVEKAVNSGVKIYNKEEFLRMYGI